jgi:hypothetical protein
MSGDINNTDILAALNQTIKAINDLCGCNQISITCGGGGNTGTQIEQESGTEGGTPPEGTSSPDPSISERKCKAANMIYDDLKAIIDQLDLQDIGTWDLVGVVPSSDLLGQIITTVGGWVGSAISSVAGMVLNAAAWLLSTFASLSFSNISSVMNTYHQDLVCALYNATDAETARADFLTILTDNGVSTVESAFVEFLMPMNVLNVLFFAVDNPDSEATLDGYMGSVDCATACPEIWWGCLEGTYVSHTVNTVTVEGHLSDGLYYCSVGVETQTTLSATETGWSDTQYNDTRYEYGQLYCGSGSGWDVVIAGWDGGPFVDIQTLRYRSSTPFTVTFTRS